MKERLKKLVDQLLPDILAELHATDLGQTDLKYDVELPKVKAYGDLSINLAFQLSKRLKRNPVEIADTCKRVLDRKKESGGPECAWLKEITVEKPGFINVKLSDSTVSHTLPEISKLDDKFGCSDFGKGKKVLIEFVSANPTGPLTIAHGRQAAVGDTLARILTAVGFEPHKEFYLNDAGRQIKLLGQSLWARYRDLFGKKTKVPEEGYQGEYLIEVAKDIKKEKKDFYLKQTEDEALKLLTDYAVRAMLTGIENDLSAINVRFDEYFSERSLIQNRQIERAIDELKKRGYLYEAGGALWFQATRFGDDKDRVLKKKNGEYTYLTSDIAYHESKFKRGYDQLINLWGPDHHGYIARVKATCEALGYSKERLNILTVQLTTLYRDGKPIRMSKRKGEFIMLRDLVDEVGSDASRFFFLMRKVGSHLEFDLELAKRRSDENPVFYVQYAHARICSILSYAKRQVTRDVDCSLIREPEALDLVKKMMEYPDVLIQAAQRLEPYRVVDYLRELATAFHRFYNAHRVVTEDEALTRARLLLTDCARMVVRNGLNVLGVSAPKSM